MPQHKKQIVRTIRTGQWDVVKGTWQITCNYAKADKNVADAMVSKLASGLRMGNKAVISVRRLKSKNETTG